MRQGFQACGRIVAIAVMALALATQASAGALRTEPGKAPAKKRATSSTAKPKATKPAARPKARTTAVKPKVRSSAARARPATAVSAPAAVAQPVPRIVPASQPAAASAVPAASQPAVESERPAECRVTVASAPAASAPAVEPISSPPAAEPAESSESLAQASQPVADPASAKQRISLGQAVVLGIVEGLTEYLPVSSTGHLILTSYWLGLAQETDEPGTFGGNKVEASPAVNAFEIVIQLGAILAVVGLYRKRVGQMVQGLLGRNPQGLRLALMLLIAFLPAAVVGLIAHDAIEEHLFGPMPVVLALAAGGVLMIVVEHYFWTRRKARVHAAEQTRSLVPVGARSNAAGPVVRAQMSVPRSSPFTKIDTMMYWQALAIGLAQCLSMWPGTSRSMITILAALVVGLDMIAAAEFSFLLALPTLGAATLYSGLKNWEPLMQATGTGGLLVGLIVSGIVAAIAVKAFVHWLTRRGLMPFGVYRIVIAAVLMAYFLG